MGSPRLQSVKLTRLRSEIQKMFVKSPLGRTFCLEDIRSARDAINVVCEKENLPTDSPSQWRAEQCGKLVTSLDSPLHHTGTLYVLPSNPLPGGKGGFGSLLRAIGAQIQKTTNHEAMRDLSGRRQRDVNNEQRMRDYAAKKADREREELEKKEENVHDAMEAAMKVASEAKEAEKDLKRKAETEKKVEPPKKKGKGLWMGDGLDGLSDSELTDSDEEKDAEEAKTVAVQ